MSIQIKAKMICSAVNKSLPQYEGDDGSESVQLYAVYSNDPTTENYTYSKATPSADLRMFIANPQAFGAFKEGKEYIITFTEAESEVKDDTSWMLQPRFEAI